MSEHDTEAPEPEPVEAEPAPEPEPEPEPEPDATSENQSAMAGRVDPEAAEASEESPDESGSGSPRD